MKLMFCGSCADLVVPDRTDRVVRWCHCNRHAVWWEDGRLGIIRVHDRMFPDRNGGDGGRAWLVGLHNQFLMAGGLSASTCQGWNLRTQREQVEALIEETPDSYLFKQARSLVIRFAPGATADSAWSKLPEAPPA